MRPGIVVDGLIISRWSDQVLAAMSEGRLTCANFTCSVWENSTGTLRNIAEWLRRIDRQQDRLIKVDRATDIERAHQQQKIGVLLGFQNTSAIEDRLELLEIYKRLGVHIIQLTYNTQNLVGSGCWEQNDSGLSGFGREVVAEMNRLSMLIDLSHVGSRTAADAIDASQSPCAFTHVCPRGLSPHPRNKTDDELKRIAGSGGFVGVAAYAPFLRDGASLDDFVDALEYVISLCGETCVGIGTDATDGQDEAFFDWLRHDKGYARRVVPTRGTAPLLEGMRWPTDYGSIEAALKRRGWAEPLVRAVMGENWLSFIRQVIG
jgi:membrane dipeptidase